MATNKIKSFKNIRPAIYAYTLPGVPSHDGWLKIGYTSHSGENREGVKKRIEEQLGTANIPYNIEWSSDAVYDDGSYEPFKDTAFHAYLEKMGIERKAGLNGYDSEWFKIDSKRAKIMLVDFKENRGISDDNSIIPYTLRDEQTEAVKKTKEYFESHIGEKPEFLWNAKPRFGKTLTTYDLCKKINAHNILIVTNRPAIANSWYSDYEKFFGTESGYYFISETDALKGSKNVYSYSDLVNIKKRSNYRGYIMFVSLQDMKGSLYFGGKYDKLQHLTTENFDILVVDEAHEGVDTSKTYVAFNQINRKYTLHLSGTPFKALENGKFGVSAIFNWTYADEQRVKRDYKGELSNPYEDMPKLNLLTYRMSDIVLERVKQGADFNDDGENEAYAFDLNEFFRTNDSGKFIHDADIDKFLDALSTQERFPYSEEYRGEMKHTLWLLNWVDSAKALEKKLKAHPVFKNYTIIRATGEGTKKQVDNDEVLEDKELKKSYDKVVKAIKENERTITLSVGQLTTGITIPEWTGVMMLSNVQSPSLYMQAAFRAQNPCTFNTNSVTYMKENAYIFDFDPARTLGMFEQMATGLYPEIAANKTDSDSRKQRVKELLNFFSVYGEDDNGEMIMLDAEKILSIPRQIHAKEVVRKGFMSNFLFQNINGVFRAPKEVVRILEKLDPVKEPVAITENTADELNLNENGEVEVTGDKLDKRVDSVFGDKIYGDTDDVCDILKDAVEKELKKKKKVTDETLEHIKDVLHTEVTNKLLDKAKSDYGKDMSRAQQGALQKGINNSADKKVEEKYADLRINQAVTENERKKAVEQAESEGRLADIANINAEAEVKQENHIRHFQEGMLEIVPDLIEETKKTIVKNVDENKYNAEKKNREGDVRDRLRGFSRTIPSFLMAYGDKNTTLKNFDSIIKPNVFLEVTGITIEEFKFLRDGGDYTDEDGVSKHFDGNLFDETVFNDSVQEFLRLKDNLADYFREDATEDIFDYIPPQRTNQIFTPKKVVKMMIDMLEQENPNCFDDLEATFIDPYMKSGLYITEIVKRLFRNEKHKEIFPDENERLVWILETQVYGLAPTEIIYRIATNYIWGYLDLHGIKVDGREPDAGHFQQLDALPYVQGTEKLTLQQKLDELFGNK